MRGNLFCVVIAYHGNSLTHREILRHKPLEQPVNRSENADTSQKLRVFP
jgi:hypothetical protein